MVDAVQIHRPGDTPPSTVHMYNYIEDDVVFWPGVHMNMPALAAHALDDVT